MLSSLGTTVRFVQSMVSCVSQRTFSSSSYYIRLQLHFHPLPSSSCQDVPVSGGLKLKPVWAFQPTTLIPARTDPLGSCHARTPLRLSTVSEVSSSADAWAGVRRHLFLARKTRRQQARCSKATTKLITYVGCSFISCPHSPIPT
jgi:hypothetical protein